MGQKVALHMFTAVPKHLHLSELNGMNFNQLC